MFFFLVRYIWLSLFRSDLDELLLNKNDASTTNGIELKNSIDVYFATCRFLSLFRENSIEYNDRLEHLCRYLLASLESENPRHSYIGVALNKELSIAWIRHIKLLLYKCCVCMEKLKPGAYLSAFYILLCWCLVNYFNLHICSISYKIVLFFFVFPETHSESLTLALYLHTMISFTSPNTWAILKSKSLTALKPGMSQLCNNVLGSLVQKGFFLSLRVCVQCLFQLDG